MTADLESQVGIQGCTSWDCRRFQRYKRGTLTADYKTLYGSAKRIFALPCIPWLPKGQRTFKNVCDLICRTTVLVILKLSLLFQVLQFVLPCIGHHTSIPVSNYRFQSLPGTLIGLIAADLFWSNKAVLYQLLESCQTPRARNSCFGWRMVLGVEVGIPVGFMYTARMMFYWPCCAISMYLSFSVFESVLCIVHTFLILCIFELLCQTVSHKLGQIAEKIRASKAAITREDLVKLSKQWDHYAFLMQDLCDAFEVFLWLWGSWMIHCFLAVLDITPNWMGDFAYQAPLEKYVLLGRTTWTLLQVFSTMRAMVLPRRSLQDVSILRSSEHVSLHIDVQKFLLKIERCPATTFFKITRLLFIYSVYVVTVCFLIRLSVFKKLW